MNWKPTLLAASIFSAMGLASCVLPEKSTGQMIRNPTVSDMARYEAEWGTATQGAVVSPTGPHATTTFTPAAPPSETASPATPPAVPPSLR